MPTGAKWGKPRHSPMPHWGKKGRRSGLPGVRCTYPVLCMDAHSTTRVYLRCLTVQDRMAQHGRVHHNGAVTA